MSFKLSIAIALLIGLFTSGSIVGQGLQQLDDANTVAMFKANFLYNFCKYSDWPSHKKQGNFVVGIVGDNDLFEELVDIYASKRIGSQILEIRKLAPPYKFDDIHVVFISSTMRDETADLVEATKDSSIMIITDMESKMRLGTVINFKIVDSRINFEVNLSEAEKRGIIIGEKLKSWAFNKQ